MDWVEIVGYVGSALVLVSFLMTSVFKLRVVNTVGSIIFAIYALIIHSYPTALMNFCLVLINLRFLWKMRSSEKSYELVESSANDPFVAYLLTRWKADIESFYPGATQLVEKANNVYVLTCEDKPAGLAAGTRKDDELTLTLDYSTPEFRDFSLGSFLYEKLAHMGIARVCYQGHVRKGDTYLAKMGFSEKNGSLVKEL